MSRQGPFWPDEVMNALRQEFGEHGGAYLAQPPEDPFQRLLTALPTFPEGTRFIALGEALTGFATMRKLRKHRHPRIKRVFSKKKLAKGCK